MALAIVVERRSGPGDVVEREILHGRMPTKTTAKEDPLPLLRQKLPFATLEMSPNMEVSENL
jgi:hypothetical protein